MPHSCTEWLDIQHFQPALQPHQSAWVFFSKQTKPSFEKSEVTFANDKSTQKAFAPLRRPMDFLHLRVSNTRACCVDHSQYDLVAAWPCLFVKILNFLLCVWLTDCSSKQLNAHACSDSIYALVYWCINYRIAVHFFPYGATVEELCNQSTWTF